MKKINKNLIKRKIYKILPKKIRFRLLRHLMPEVKLNLNNFVFRPAVSPNDYLSAFNLVYRVFVGTGFIKRSSIPFRMAAQHAHEDSRVFIGCQKEGDREKIVYSLSIFPDSDEGLPMDSVFQKEVDSLRSEGRFVVEAGQLASDPCCRTKTMDIPLLGNKILHQYAAQHLNADDIVIAVHPKYQWIYEDLLLFEKIGETSQYAYANNNPALAMRLDLRTAAKKYQKRYKNINLKNNLYHFFFTKDSDSILLPDRQYWIQPEVLDNFDHLSKFKSQTMEDNNSPQVRSA